MPKVPVFVAGLVLIVAAAAPLPGMAQDQEVCHPGLAEADSAMTRMRLDEQSAELVATYREQADAAQEAGDMEACRELIQEIRYILHLDH